MTAQPKGGTHGEDGQGELLSVTVLVLCATALFVTAWLFVDNGRHSHYPWVNHDVAFMSWAGEEILRGSRLYVDFYETSLPGGPFLHAGLAKLAHVLSASVLLVDHLFVLALGVAGLAVVWVALLRDRANLAFAMVAPAYTLAVVRGNFSNNVIPSAPFIPYDFGQREHLFALLFAPYVLWRLTRGPTRGAMLVYLAALGFVAVLEPQWLGLLVLVEGLVALRERRADRAVWMALFAGAAVPWILLASSWASVKAFFGEVVPVMLLEGYGGYGMGSGFFTSTLHFQMIGAAVVFAMLWTACVRAAALERGQAALAAVVVAGSYATVVVQEYGSYHGMVYFGVVVVLGTWLVSRLVGRLRASAARMVVSAAVALGMLLLVGVGVTNLGSMLASYPPKGYALVPLIKNRGKLMFVSTTVDYAYAPLVTGKETVGPWRGQFRLGAITAIEDAARRDAALREYVGRVVARIESERPDMLLFAPARPGLPPGVHIHDLMVPYGVITDDYEPVLPEAMSVMSPRLKNWYAYRRSAPDA